MTLTRLPTGRDRWEARGGVGWSRGLGHRPPAGPRAPAAPLEPRPLQPPHPLQPQEHVVALLAPARHSPSPASPTSTPAPTSDLTQARRLHSQPCVGDLGLGLPRAPTRRALPERQVPATFSRARGDSAGAGAKRPPPTP